MESMAWLREGFDTGSLEECKGGVISSEGRGGGSIGPSDSIAPGCY
jgi:hypothetical protein